jgi:O-antigen ligase
MPSELALWLCTAFVAWLLWLDRKQAPDLSNVVWLPTIWSLLAGSRSLSSWFSQQGDDQLAGSLLDQIFEGMLLIIAFFILMRRNVDWSEIIHTNRWLLILLGFMLLSVGWSDIPGVTFRRWIKELGAVAMAFLLLTERSPCEAVQSVLRRTVYILIPFSVLLIKYFHDFGVNYDRWTGEIQWVGVTVQKNGLGRLCMIAAFFLVWTWASRRDQRQPLVAKYQNLFEGILFLMTIWLLKGPSMWAASATAIVCLCVGLAAFGVLRWMTMHGIHLGTGTCVVIIAGVMILGVITPLVGGTTVGQVTSLVGRNATLTGRTDIWAGLIPEVQERPFLGSGFSSFWTPHNRAIHIGGEAHNGYLDVWLGLGFVGLLVTLIFLLSCSFKAARAMGNDYEWGSFCLCLLLMASLHNWSESSFDSLNRHLMTIVLFVTVSVSMNRQRARMSPAEEDAPIIEAGGCEQVF